MSQKNSTLLIATAALCVLTASWRVSAEGQAATQPAVEEPSGAGEATTQPGPLLNFDAIKELNIIMEQARPTEAERIMCTAVRDRNPQIDGALFYAMLNKTDKMTRVEPKLFTCLNRLSTPAVMLEPEKYRMAPTRLSILVFEVQILTPGRGLSRSWAGPDQPDLPVYMILAENAECDYPAMEGMKIFTTKNPLPLLGDPDKYDEKERLYQYRDTGVRLEMAGLFYKLSRESDKANMTVRDFPVFIAWQFADPSEIGRTRVETSSGTMGVLLFVLVVGLGIAFFVFMKSVRRSKDSEPMILAMKKKREQEARQKMQTGEHEPVDPALQNALEEFEKSRNTDNEKDSGKSG